VEETCSRVVILNRGRVAAEGTVAEVTRQVAAPRRGRFQVPAELRGRAAEVLAKVPGFASAQPLDGREDWVVAALDDAPAIDGGPHVDVSAGVRALAAAGIPVLAFELEGARLSDAFLAMTADG
jgi:ABC-2 type transport system ATP-binding protein